MDSAKAALRRVMKARIAALDAAYDKAAGEGIVRRLTAHPAWAAADSVFCYVGRRGEIDTRPLLRAALEAGKTLAVPLCMGPGVMQARAVRSLEELGYGGGYYDRFLPLACNAVKIALCRAVLLEPVLPRECHDVRADFVLTEDALYACKGGG